jgi:hypothetical protein
MNNEIEKKMDELLSLISGVINEDSWSSRVKNLTHEIGKCIDGNRAGVILAAIAIIICQIYDECEMSFDDRLEYYNSIEKLFISRNKKDSDKELTREMFHKKGAN